MRLAHTRKGLISQFPKTALAVATSGAVVISVMILLLVGIGAAPGEDAQANQALATQADPLAGVSAKTRSYVERIASMSNEELAATFGTGYPSAASAAVLASLSPQARRYVQTITSMSNEELAATFGTGR